MNKNETTIINTAATETADTAETAEAMPTSVITNRCTAEEVTSHEPKEFTQLREYLEELLAKYSPAKGRNIVEKNTRSFYTTIIKNSLTDLDNVVTAVRLLAHYCPLLGINIVAGIDEFSETRFEDFTEHNIPSEILEAYKRTQSLYVLLKTESSIECDLVETIVATKTLPYTPGKKTFRFYIDEANEMAYQASCLACKAYSNSLNKEDDDYSCEVIGRVAKDGVIFTFV